jgi:uncharacterized membrane protein YphA (DoxX/SURF4 family)
VEWSRKRQRHVTSRERVSLNSVRDARTAAIGFLLVQVVIGYEWLSSGLTKLKHGDFPGGLANDLHERATHASSWYGNFLDSVVIPHASTWGYAIEIAEVAIGVTLIVSAVARLMHPMRSVTAWLAGLTAAAAFGGLLLALNLTFANGYGVGPIGPDSFDEGITLDVLLIGIQAILCGVSLRTLADSRRPTLETVPRSARGRAA